MASRTSPLDALDAALARMQGDDSGGGLTEALDAARRVRVERKQLTDAEAMVAFAAQVTRRLTAGAEDAERERRAAERRLHARVHKTGAMVAASVFAVGALLADGAVGLVCLLAVVGCTVVADWPVRWRSIFARRYAAGGVIRAGFDDRRQQARQ